MTDAAIPLYSAKNLPAEYGEPGGAAWGTFRKSVPTQAIRIHGPFRVETSESENEPFFCEDGWLAIDARGYPYAIADAEFTQIYEPAEAAAGPVLPARDVVLGFLERYDGDMAAEREGREHEFKSHDEGAAALVQLLADAGYELGTDSHEGLAQAKQTADEEAE
jgi:hypothetical protein